MIDSTIVNLEEMRNSSAEHIFQIMETAIVDFTNFEWKKSRICRRRQLDGIESEESPEDQWRRNTFFVVINTILSSMQNRFEKNKSLYQILSVFSPSRVGTLRVSYTTVKDLQCEIAAFCDKYHLDSYKCAEELFNFADVYHRFHVTTDDYDENLNDAVSDDDMHEEPSCTAQNASIFSALAILDNPIYHLMDAFTELCRAYSIAVAIPVMSCTAERSFSALKWVKTYLRSTMIQDRLEGLVQITVERKLLMSLQSEIIIDKYASSSAELSRALLQ